MRVTNKMGEGWTSVFFNLLLTSKTYIVLGKLVVRSQAVLHFYRKIGKTIRIFQFMIGIKIFQKRRTLELISKLFCMCVSIPFFTKLLNLFTLLCFICFITSLSFHMIFQNDFPFYLIWNSTHKLKNWAY